MNLRRTLLLLLSLAIASVASAQGVKIVQNTINKDSLPDDAIIVKRVPLESGPAFEAKDVLVVDTIPSSSEGLNIVLYNDNTWRFVRNRNIDVYMADTQEQEDFFFSELARMKAEQGIPADVFVHYDTPCTIQNQIAMLKAAGFATVEQVMRVGGTCMLVAKK